MQFTLRRFAKLAASYSLVAVLGPLVSILLTPLYTRVLEPADYGIIEVALTLVSFCTMIATLGLDQALAVFFFDKGPADYQQRLVTTALVYGVCVSAFFCLVILIFSQPLAILLFKDAGRALLLRLLALHVLAYPLAAIATAALRLRMGVKRVNALALTSLTVSILTNITAILIFGLKATGIVIATTLTSLATAAIGLILIRKPLLGQFELSLTKPLLRVGTGLMIGTLSVGMLSNVDRLLLTQFAPPADIGLYTIANKLATMVYVLLSAGWNAWWPMALDLAHRPEELSRHSRMMEVFAATSMLLALFVGLFSPEILSILTRSAYVPAAPYVATLLIYMGPVSFVGAFFQLGLFAEKQALLISGIYASAAGLNVIFNLMLNPSLGVWGAVIATLLSGVALTTGLYIFGQRALYIPYRLGRVAILGVIYIGLIVSFILWPSLNNLGTKVVFLVVLAVAVPMTGIIPLSQIIAGLTGLYQFLAQSYKSSLR